MVRRINLFLVALALVGVIVGGQVQAMLAQSVSDSPVTIQNQHQVQRIEVTGSTIFGEAEFKPIIESVEGRTVTIEELRSIADAISQLYLEQGYITSRAVLIEESLSGGVVEIRVIEGSLEEIQVEGTRWVEDDYIRSKVERATATPLNTLQIEDLLLSLRADPLFEKVEASLRAGTGLGQSILVVRVTERFGLIRTRVQLSGRSPLSVARASLFEQIQLGSVSLTYADTYYADTYAKPSVNNPADAPKILAQIYKKTGVKPAFMYATFVGGRLELRMISARDKKIASLPGVTQETIVQTATKLRREITNPIKRITTSYLEPAQQLYEWLIAPLEAELEAQGIQNLVFIMDSGLRSLPLAALHDGQRFLVEKYSVGLMPSFSITNTSYKNIQNAPVLAMGIAESSSLAKELNLSPLPAVPLELQAIASIRDGETFLNEKVTLETLKTQSQNAKIVHLATHGEFKSGPLENSYILLWNDLLRLNQLRELGWNNRQSPIELFVFTAARTTIGDENAELGFAGLALQAGVKSALSSLWYVSDEGTLGLTLEFYQQLNTAPIKAEALRQAQLAMLKGHVRIEGGELRASRQSIPLPPILANQKDQSLSHPYYWAGFTMIGSPW